MTDTPPTTNAARETLSGDRLCMECLHPLVGRTIEREKSTGLLYVRCGECGTASALLEYPTATPWIHRMKTVAASTLAIFVVLASIALGGVSGGFTAGCAQLGTEVSAKFLARAHLERLQTAAEALVPDIEDDSFTSDLAWLASPDGEAALAASRRDPVAILSMLVPGPIGSALVIPFALILGVLCMRRSWLARAFWVSLPATLGGAIAILYALSVNQYFNANVRSGSVPTWQSVAEARNLLYFSTVSAVWFVWLSAVVGLIAPSLVAGIFRFILPPRDRRLVAWLWEWRGLRIPTR